MMESVEKLINRCESFFSGYVASRFNFFLFIPWLFATIKFTDEMGSYFMI